ncbi:Endonuclease [Fimbriiglobus ruber]|uniref:Endonuclease n=2 Tax=Fimbriiglobus ruber TaxID=1908690 RepID=A0A225DZN8_9BACT|nr:Endonuclease [Fimbriiglobus ruber]
MCLVAVASAPAFAWSKAGHQTTGAIAYRVLKKESPGTIPKVVAILRKHPYFTEAHRGINNKLSSWEDTCRGLTEDEQNEFLFMMACRWADDSRPDVKFYPKSDRVEAQHYINRPFKPAGQPDTVKLVEPDEINIIRGFSERLTKFKTATTDADRAVAMCFVMHFIGDAHQPLHTVSLCTTEFQVVDNGKQVGDRGGTRFMVRGSEGGRPINLHYFWDGLITNEEDFRKNQQVAIALLDPKLNPDFAKEKFADALAVTDFERWIDESFQLVPKAYYFNDKLLSGSIENANAGVLPEGYSKAVQPIGFKRGVLAGYRIAYTLKDVLGN